MVCDFKTVFNLLYEYTSDSKLKTHTAFLNMLFKSYNEYNRFKIERDTASKLFSGTSRIFSELLEEIQHDKKKLYKDVSDIVNHHVFNKNELLNDFTELVVYDETMPEDVKQSILSIDNKSDFVAETVYISLARPYSKVGNLFAVQNSSPKFSPAISSFFKECEPPSPVKHFCGRTEELNEIHNLLNDYNHIFIRGIGGIGKSEFVKAYAKNYKKDYTNILYFNYRNSLSDMLADMDNNNDLSNERFRANNRILRSMQEDTLLIIDNFNVTETEDDFLPVLLKYKCRILFTTRCVFDCGYTYELKEISDENILVDLFSKFYSDTENNIDAVTQIIRTVYAHTFITELSARLLEKGLLTPEKLLEKLKESSVNSSLKDKIKAVKDNVYDKATYHDHIQLLYNLFALSDTMQSLMRTLCFVSADGIPKKLFAELNSLETANELNDLIENGLIHNSDNNKISLHPLISDIVSEDLKPSVINCSVFLNSINSICLNRSEINKNYRLIFSICENISTRINIDDFHRFVRFLNDAVSYMDDMKYDSGMENILNRLSDIANEMNQSELAIYYSHLSGLEFMRNNRKKAEMYIQKSLSICPPDYDHLAYANISFSAGNFYKLSGKTDIARKYMEQGISHLNIADDGSTILYDKYNMMLSYILLLSESHHSDDIVKATRLLKRGLSEIEKIYTKDCILYADYSYYLGCMLYNSGDKSFRKYLRNSLEIHNRIYDYAPESYIDRIEQISLILNHQ